MADPTADPAVRSGLRRGALYEPVPDGWAEADLGAVPQPILGLHGTDDPISSLAAAASRAWGLSVRFMGISRHAIASYLVSLYCSLAVLTEDALAVLDDVEVGKIHDYGYTYR